MYSWKYISLMFFHVSIYLPLPQSFPFRVGSRIKWGIHHWMNKCLNFPKDDSDNLFLLPAFTLIYFLILFAGILFYQLFPLSILSSISLFLLGPFSQSVGTFNSLLSETNKWIKTKQNKCSLSLNFASQSFIQPMFLYLLHASYCCWWWRQNSCFPPGASEGTQIINIQTTQALLQLCYSRLGQLVPSLKHLPSALSMGWCGLSDRVWAGFQSPGPLAFIGLHKYPQQSLYTPPPQPP